jgi:DNA-binding transcriptional ArsR family regulator
MDERIFFSVEYEEKPENRESIKKMRDAIGSETRKAILRKIVREPTTATTLADDLELSKPGVGKHLEILKQANLIRETQVAEKKYKNEKYYEATFPFLTLEDHKKIRAVIERITEAIEPTIKSFKEDLEKAFEETTMAQKGGKLADLSSEIRLELGMKVGGLLEFEGWPLKDRPWFVKASEKYK